jgi:serine/threonine protein kinase
MEEKTNLSCKIVFIQDRKESYCILDSDIQNYEKIDKVYILQSDIVIDSVSYAVFKSPKFKSFIAVNTGQKVINEKDAYFLYSLKPVNKIDTETKDELKFFDERFLSKGAFGSVSYFPTQNVVVKTSTSKTKDLPRDIVKEIALYNLLYKITCLPKLYDFELSDKTRMIFERGVNTVKEAYNNFDLKQAKIVMFRILKCMRNTASQGIIHCDLKPDNLIISEDGNVQIIDWGLAEIDTSVGQTRVKSIAGSLVYMAPEQLLLLPYSNKRDIFALGLIFLEIYNKQYKYRSDIKSIISYKDFLEAFLYDDELWKCVKEEKLTFEHIQKNLMERFGVEDRVFADLTARMLYPNPDKRITYDEALIHPYFQSIRRERIPTLPKFVNNMPIIPSIEEVWTTDSLRFDIREILFLRVVNSCRDFHLSNDTLFLTLQLIDYCVYKKKRFIKPPKITVLINVCLLIASKLFDKKPVVLDSLSNENDVKNYMIELEREVVYNVFKGNLYMPSLWSYVENYFDKDNLPSSGEIYKFYLQKDIYDKDMSEKFKEIIS